MARNVLWKSILSVITGVCFGFSGCANKDNEYYDIKLPYIDNPHRIEGEEHYQLSPELESRDFSDKLFELKKWKRYYFSHTPFERKYDRNLEEGVYRRIKREDYTESEKKYIEVVEEHAKACNEKEWILHDSDLCKPWIRIHLNYLRRYLEYDFITPEVDERNLVFLYRIGDNISFTRQERLQMYQPE